MLYLRYSFPGLKQDISPQARDVEALDLAHSWYQLIDSWSLKLVVETIINARAPSIYLFDNSFSTTSACNDHIDGACGGGIP